jgi:hypothetical protein
MKINRIKSDRKNSEKRWNELSDGVKNAIEDGIVQANNGQTISHKEFKEKFKKSFSK